MCASGRRNSLGTVRSQRVGPLDAPLPQALHSGLPALLLLAPQRQIPSRASPLRPCSPEATNGAPPVRHCVRARSEARERRARK